jgi:intein/homing endonuclease
LKIKAAWLDEIIAKWHSGVAHAFLVTGNIDDQVAPGVFVRDALIASPLLAARDFVAVYNRSSGITFPVAAHRQKFLDALGIKRQDANPAMAALRQARNQLAEDDGVQLPSDPLGALAVLERALLATKKDSEGEPAGAVIIENAEVLAPNADVSAMGPEDRTVFVTLLKWARERAFLKAGSPVFLLSELPGDVNMALRRASGRIESVKVPYPGYQERLDYIESLNNAAAGDPESRKRLAGLTAALKLVHVEDIFLRACADGVPVTDDIVRERKGEIVSSEFEGILGILEPKASLDMIGGLQYVKDFFTRNVILPMKDGRYARVPMGVLLMGPAGTGKCVTGDTLVSTNKGTIFIRDIPKYYWVDPDNNSVEGLVVAGLSGQEFANSKASHFYDLGNQNTVIVKTEQGHSIEGTYEHPIIVLNSSLQLEFKKLLDVEVGDWAAIKVGCGSYGCNKDVDQETAYLLGLLTGDGNMTLPNSIRFTSRDDELRVFFEDYFKARYGKEPRAVNKYDYVLNGQEIKQDFVDKGLPPLLSYRKKVPVCIMQGPKEIQKAYLQGLFDTDGTFNRYAFSYSTASRTLLDQVSAMLLNMGIFHTKGRKNVGKDRRPSYQLCVSGYYLQKFSDAVGFRLIRKKVLLERYIACHPISETNYDVVPFVADSMKFLRRGLRSCELTSDDLKGIYADKDHLIKATYSISARDRISKTSLRYLISLTESKNVVFDNMTMLKNILNAGIVFNKVASAECARNHVFDLTVPGCHSFVGNGFINHNTVLAEAVAKESGMNCCSLNVGQLLGSYVGQSERNLERALDCINALAPTIVIVDEIDQAGLGRGASGDSGVSNRIFRRLLEFMSDGSRRGRILFLGITNRPDLLDAAFKRPGRFDKKIPILAPSPEEREAILRALCRKYDLGCPEGVSGVVARTDGWTGAELEALVLKAYELADDSGEAFAEKHLMGALEVYIPTTQNIGEMTALALAECSDIDLLPPEYREAVRKKRQTESLQEAEVPLQRGARRI